MSRSLRSRPVTLYAQDGQAVGAQTPVQPSTLASRIARRHAGDAEGEDKVRNRLSVRYASSQVGAGYGSGLPMLTPMTGVTEEEEHEANGVSSAAPALSYFGSPTVAHADGDTMPMAITTPTQVSATWETFGKGPELDANTFAKEDFDARTFVSTQLQQQSESGLRGVNESLSRIQDETQKQLKTQVFKNYAEFITISKEIATLENDMLEFKDLLSEWKQLPQQLKIEDPLREFGIGSLKGNRSSLVDLEQIYKAQIAALWENIEGSQKFVPYAPNRHLIAETSQFIELNAATYKPKQAVALFLLDSLLLIAVQRRKHYGSQVHLVAERAFGLSEIVVVDLKDTKDLKNALKIKRGKEVYVYRTEQVQEKRTLLNAFRRVGEDLANKMKLERKSRDSVKRIGEGSISDALGLPEDVSAKKTDADMQTLGPWLNTVIDDLAVHIALREWEAAVSLIEDGKKRLANRPVSEGPLYLLVENFNVCANELVGAISAELGSPYQCKSIMVRDANLLLRLDKGREARDLLLSARSELLRRRTRQIKYEGDVSLYISELAMLYFTLIKNTGDWYMTAFKDYKMASGFVQWASDQVRSYGETFRRQVYGVDQDPDVVKEAKEITMNCAQILNDVGLNLAFMLMELLQPSEHHNDFPILSLSVAEAEAQAHRRRLEQQLQASEQ